MDGGPQGQRGGSYFWLREGLRREVGPLALLGALRIAADPDATSGRLLLRGVRGGQSRVVYTATFETLAARFGDETDWRLLGGAGVVAFLPAELTLSLDLSVDSELRSLEWWSQLSPPVRTDRLRPTILTREPRAEISLRDSGQRRAVFSFERRSGDWAWVESSELPGLWEPRDVDANVLGFGFDGPVSSQGAFGLWVEHTQDRRGGDIPYRAPWTWHTHGSWRLAGTRWSAALRGENDASTEDGSRRLGWVTLDLGAVFPLSRGFEVGLSAVNIFDEEWAVWRSYPETGRAVRVSLRRGWEDLANEVPRGASWYRENYE
jgi:hypothetical protein